MPHNCHCPTCGACYTRTPGEVTISQVVMGYYVMECDSCLAIPIEHREKVMRALVRILEGRRLCKQDADMIAKYPDRFNGYEPVIKRLLPRR